MISFLAWFPAALAMDNESGLDWLEDQPPLNTITRTQTNKLSTITAYPRRSIGSIKQSLTAAQMACFDIICQKPFSAVTVASAQSINPNLSYLRIYSPQAWQGAADGPDVQGNGYPFNTSGDATANNEIFAGHWAYKPYTTLSIGISTESGITLSVAHSDNVQDGTYYYVIRPADSWDNAEHIKITKSGQTITINERAYKSIAKSWPAGSIIAQHQLGNGTGNLNWCYNLSIKCPPDANNKKAYEAFSSWLVENYAKDGNGDPSAAVVDGILYDADPLAFVDGGGIAGRNADLDNDGEADWGYDSDGTNHWGSGLELFYSGVRKGFDDKGLTDVVILGGVAESYGVIPNNGTQMEAAWSHQFGEDGAKAGKYNHIGFYISGMKAQTGHGIIAPRVTDVQSKEASAVYHGETVETRNAPVRFSYSMTMMFDGSWFSNQNGFGDAFHYFDEDAVYLESGNNYCKSVLKTNTTDILLNNKWLGKALGQYRRNYDKTTFSQSNNLIQNGDFEDIPDPWTGTGATITRVTDQHYTGSASLCIAPIRPNSSLQIDGAVATGPSITMVSDQEYTLCFATLSSAPERIIRVRLGSFSQKLFITPGWSKHVVTWKEENGVTSALKFDVGAELTTIWIDQLCLFAGCADVFRRDFENGIILANASSSPKTISLEGQFRRITGNLDTEVNNGQQDISEVTLPAYDGLFLIRQGAASIGNSGENLYKTRLRVYPNVFDRIFRIDVPEDAKRLEVFDIRGKRLFNMDIEKTGTIKFDCLADKAAGSYFVKITGVGWNRIAGIVKK